MDARYCTLSRVSFGLIAGGAGAGSGEILRAPSAPGRPGAAGAAGLDTASTALCGLASRPCGSTLRSCASTLRPCGSPLSDLAGVGQCPLAIGHGCLVGLLACWIAGPYRHCRLRRRAVGRARAGTVAGGSPTAPCTLRVWCQWCRPLLVRVQPRHRVADRQRRAASPVSGIPD